MRLKPDRYYEVTNGIELTFADVKCQYLIGQPPTNQIAATEPVATTAPGICQETQPQVIYHHCMIAFISFHINFALVNLLKKQSFASLKINCFIFSGLETCWLTLLYAYFDLIFHL